MPLSKKEFAELVRTLGPNASEPEILAAAQAEDRRRMPASPITPGAIPNPNEALHAEGLKVPVKMAWDAIEPLLRGLSTITSTVAGGLDSALGARPDGSMPAEGPLGGAVTAGKKAWQENSPTAVSEVLRKRRVFEPLSRLYQGMLDPAVDLTVDVATDPTNLIPAKAVVGPLAAAAAMIPRGKKALQGLRVATKQSELFSGLDDVAAAAAKQGTPGSPTPTTGGPSAPAAAQLSAPFDPTWDAAQKAKVPERLGAYHSPLPDFIDQLHTVGEPGMNWYTTSLPIVTKMLGAKALPMLKYFSASSPNASVKANARFAVKAMEQFEAGEAPSGFMKSTIDRLTKAHAGEEFGGRKVKDFFAALLGDPDAVVVDRWVSRIWGIDQSPTDKQYTEIEKQIRAHAKRLGIEPRQLQASLWTAAKKHWGRPGDTDEPFEELLQGLIANRPIFNPTGLTRKFAPEDVAGVEPPLFTGTQIQKYVSDILAAHKANKGGSTYNLRTGVPSEGYAVSAFPEREVVLPPRTKLTPQALVAFINKNADLLKDPRNSVGTWHVDKASASERYPAGATTIGVTAVPRNFSEARALARSVGEEQIYDLGLGKLYSTFGPKPETLPDIATRLDGIANADVEPIFLEHRSSTAGLGELTPRKFGSGVNSEERKRATNYGNDFLPRTFYTRRGGEVEPRVKELPHTYDTADGIPSNRIYDIGKDPEGLWDVAHARAKEQWGETSDPGVRTMLERVVADSGYLGFSNSEHPTKALADTVVLFGPANVKMRAGADTSGQAFKKFFSDVTTGAEQYKPQAEWSPLLPLRKQQAFVDEYAKHTGNFDNHIATSIPGFKDVQVRKGAALVKALGAGARVLDVGASEGSFAKAISGLSNGKIETVALDPNPDMAKFFSEKSAVPGSRYDTRAFESGFEDNGVLVEAFNDDKPFDVVHESMVFQFISPQRNAQVAEVKRLLAPDGVFMTEEKFLTDPAVWAANEAKKDTEFKKLYFSDAKLKKKQAVVKFQQDPGEAKAVGMVDNMVSATEFESLLRQHFRHVVQYWDSGNFRGYAASDSLKKLEPIVQQLGDLNTTFTTTRTPRKVGATATNRAGRSVKLRAIAGPAAALAVPDDPESSTDELLRAGLMGAGAASLGAGFYSRLGKSIEKIPGNAIKAQSALKLLQKLGVKAEELEFTGIGEELAKRGDQKISKQELQELFQQNQIRLEQHLKGDIDVRGQDIADETTRLTANMSEDETVDAMRSGDLGGGMLDGGRTRYSREEGHSKLQLPGGQKYRELVITLPAKKAVGPKVLDGAGGLTQATEGGVNYTSSHWDEPNPIAHVRFNERHTPDGKKVLFVEESQSDWHQAGAKHGYKRKGRLIDGKDYQWWSEKSDELFNRKTDPALLMPEREAAEKEWRKAVEARNVLMNSGSPDEVPDAPFKGTGWQELTLKRMIQWASENGFDEVAWTTGKQQGKRYNKLLEGIRGVKKDRTGALIAVTDAGPRVLSQAQVDELIRLAPEADKRPLEQLFVKTVSGGPGYSEHYMLTAPLTLNSKGMEAQYDAAMVAIANRLGKAHGAGVRKQKVTTTERRVAVRPQRRGGEFVIVAEGGDLQGGPYKTRESAEAEAQKRNATIKGEEVWSLPITPSLREMVMKEGLSLLAVPVAAGAAAQQSAER